jgi:hypothetical protein
MNIENGEDSDQLARMQQLIEENKRLQVANYKLRKLKVDLQRKNEKEKLKNFYLINYCIKNKISF